MNSAREDILANIRRSLGVNGQESTRQLEVQSRLAQKPRGPIPSRGAGALDSQLELFKREAELVSAKVHLLEQRAEIPSQIARLIADHDLPQALRMGADQKLTSLDWSQTGLALAIGPSEGQDLAALSHAYAGIAETGTLVLLSGANNPTSLNFLPDVHFVALALNDLVGDMESVWARLRERDESRDLPRTLNLITGPSRSADIEQTLLLGAHGPRHLHILIYRN